MEQAERSIDDVPTVEDTLESLDEVPNPDIQEPVADEGASLFDEMEEAERSTVVGEDEEIKEDDTENKESEVNDKPQEELNIEEEAERHALEEAERAAKEEAERLEREAEEQRLE